MIINIPFRDYKKFPITQLFGERFLYRGKIVSHKGIDWAMPKLTPLLAPISGRVYRVEQTRLWGYGRTVYIQNTDAKNDKVQVILAHCESINVKFGDRVVVGDRVSLSGRTGFWRGVNGYHLHFGVKINGIYVNPLKYLKIPDPRQVEIFPEVKDQAILKSFLGDYVVKEGDTLWKISQTFYGHGTHYIDIFNANQDIIADPNKIKAGQRLRLPILLNKGI